MKTKIINSEEITKNMTINILSYSDQTLSKEEIDEQLDILSAINDGQIVYNLTTNNGEYLLYVKKSFIRI